MSKATFNREELLAALITLNRVVERRNLILILSHVLITASGNWLTIRGTDLDIECTVKVPAKVQGSLKFAVPAYGLLDMVRKAKSENVVVESENEKIVFRFGTLRIAMVTGDHSKYPWFEKMDTSFSFDMPAADLAMGLTRCSGSMSVEETRYYLNGVYFHPLGKTLRVVATDGHRLAQQDLPMPASAGQIPPMIMPRKMVDVMIRALGKSAHKVVHVKCLGSKDMTIRVIFVIGNTQFETKLIDGTFPDYQRVVPSGNDKELVIDRKNALETLKSVITICSVKGRAVKMAMNGKTTFSMHNPDVGTASQNIDGELLNSQGKREAMEIGFNSHYLIAILEEMTSDEITIKLSDPGSPTIFTGRDDKRALHVLMPMRV